MSFSEPEDCEQRSSGSFERLREVLWGSLKSTGLQVFFGEFEELQDFEKRRP
jgi:hypothetical protein